jgi:RimJ/RimL family protein N-acetyltransferase
MILSTERLILREIVDDDAAFILTLLNDASFITNIGDRGVRTLDDARAYIRKGPAASYAQHGFGLWLVEVKETGKPAGICGLLKRDFLEHPDIGFAFLPPYQSKGYGFESAAAVLQYARDRIGVTRVLAIVNGDNTASARLLEKLGMSFEQMVKPYPEEPPLRLFGMTLSEPGAAGRATEA